MPSRAIALPCIWAGPLVWSQPIQALARPTAQQLLSPSMKAIFEIRQVWQRCKAIKKQMEMGEKEMVQRDHHSLLLSDPGLGKGKELEVGEN